MTVAVVSQTSNKLVLQVTFEFNESMLESESKIQDTLNEAGSYATGILLKNFDTDGSKIVVGHENFTSKGLYRKAYQTPYGEIDIERHLYQTAEGGATYCPLEQNARIILTSTPRFASIVSNKMASNTAAGVIDDLEGNHNRPTTKNVVQRLSDVVAAVVEAKEENWSYSVPAIEEADVHTVSLGLDGTCMLMCDGAWRQAMVGTVALYDADGERLHTTYVAAAPEYGKESFKERFTREIERTKALYPQALRLGIADGAHDNWSFLEQHTEVQILDFYHATEYLANVAHALFAQGIERKAWLDDRCHELKHTSGAAKSILTELELFSTAINQKQPIMWSINPSNNKAKILDQPLLEAAKELTRAQSQADSTKIRTEKLKALTAAMTYFKNNINKSRMNYSEHMKANRPIGSGVTEAACKTIVKQRLCQSGMRWKDKGAKGILSLRALVKSSGRWPQFWKKVNQLGFPVTV